MHLFVMFSLLLDISSDDFFVACRSHGVDIVALRPKLPSPQELLNFGMEPENFFGCDTFRKALD